MTVSDRPWDTKDEIVFLRGLGIAKWGFSLGRKRNRIALLKSYINNMARRDDWAGMDKEKVRGAALYLLGKEYDVVTDAVMH